MSAAPAESSLLASDPLLVTRLRRFSLTAAAAAAAGGLAVLLGWALDIDALKSAGPGLESMKPNAAVGFVLVGVGLAAITPTEPSSRRIRAGAIASGAAGLIGLATLLQYLLGWDLRIDQLLFADTAGPSTVHPGRMAPTTAAGFLALAGALLLGGAGRHRAAGFLASLVGLTSFIALLGYLYQVPALFRVPDHNAMAMHTALIFLLTALGAMLVRPERLAISARNAGGTLLRRLFPAMVLTMVVLGWMQVRAQRNGLTDSPTGASVLVAVRILILTGLIAWTAASLRKIELGRVAAERALRDLNLELEDRVRARTSELAASEERFRLLAETAPVGIIRHDAKGRCTYVNQQWSAITGLAAEQAMGDGWSATIQPEERERVTSAWDDAAESGSDVRLRYRVRAPDGGDRWVDSLAVAVRDGDGTSVRGYVGTLTDVSAQVEATRAIAEARDRAVDASKSKSDFLATMSHEIRTPMNGVIGLSGLLLDTELTETQRSYAEGVWSSGEALLTIINDILDFSKIEAGKLELEEVDFSIIDVVEQVGALVAEPARAKGLELVAHCSPDTPAAVRGDAGRLRQILLNFAGNAVKFTGAGEVIVRAFPEEAPGPKQVTMRFEVTDSGPGIDASDAERLFEPFAQADVSTTRRYGGTGLGLAICRRLATAMGGTIGLESRPGEGSTFWLRLCFAGAGEAAASPHGPDSDLQGMRVLVIDDHPAGRRVLASQMRSWGIGVDEAGDAQEALQHLRAADAEGRPYGLALVDQDIPVTGGLELAKIMRAEPGHRAVGLVLLTTGPADPQVGAGEGFPAILPKPVRVSQLRETLSSAMDRQAAEPAGHGLSAQAQVRLGTVLVVEDRPINQEVATGLITKLGYAFGLANDGVEALTALENGSYDAVLMDCHMPEMDGFQTTREIRRREAGRSHTPIIAMTAGALIEDREKCSAAGMDDYLVKPINEGELESVLARWVPVRP